MDGYLDSINGIIERESILLGGYMGTYNGLGPSIKETVEKLKTNTRKDWEKILQAKPPQELLEKVIEEPEHK